MKLSILGTVVLGLSAIAPVGLLAQEPIRMAIPFDFTVGSKALPAGEYILRHPSSAIVSLQSMDGKSFALVLVNNSYKRAQDGKVHLIFNRYGNQHFLSQISKPEDAWDLPKSRQEKEMFAKVSAQPVNVIVATK